MLNLILDIGKSSLLSHQRAIAVTSHNIANVNTVGYSRQRAIFATRIPLDSRPGQLGTGVKIESIERIYDRFTVEQLNNANSELEKWNAMGNALANIEAIFNEAPGFGINDALNKFFNAWHDLANNPTGMTERENLVSCAQILASRMKNIMQRLGGIKSEINQTLDLMLGGTASLSSSGGSSINGLASELADLNEKIFKAEIGGNNANDYRDRRDMLVRDLTAKLGATAYEDAKGNVNIQLSNGMPVVEGFFSYNVSMGASGEILLNLGGSYVDVTSAVMAGGGTVSGLLEVRDGIIDGYMTTMDIFASELMDQINAIHRISFGLPPGDPASTGNDFFIGTGANDMAVNPDLLARLSLIAASSDDGEEGNNSAAIAIAMLQDARFAALNNSTFNDFFAALVGKVGADLNTINSQAQQYADIVNNLENYRESISGVNPDEEMIDLIRFQHAYEAAAKLIAVTDELYVTLLSIK